MVGTWRLVALSAVLLSFTAAGAAPPKPDEILTLSERVADYQLAHMGEPIPHMRPETYDPRGWVEGALFVGLSALADQSKNPRYAEAIYNHGVEQKWELGARPFHADDHVIGQTWVWSYEYWLDPKMIAPIRARFDAIIAAAPNGSLDFIDTPNGEEPACQQRWCWSDALFMGPPGWFELTRATGDKKYAAFADKEFWATTDRLFSKEDSLYYRDSRFIGRKGEHGEKIFWSRGNGWVYAGLARIIEFLPADAPERARYVDLFKKMSVKLVSLQKPDGYWPVSLEGPGEGTPPETSGTGFFTYGLAYGVASGILTDPKYRAAAEKGWAALTKAVEENGKLGWVQPIGAAPDAVTREDTQLFGVGAFLLAGSGMMDMERPHTAVKLTLHNPKALKRHAARVSIPSALLPKQTDLVAVLGPQVAPLQATETGAIAVLDIPAKAKQKLVLRPRYGFDAPLKRYAGAAIPLKQVDGSYRAVPSIDIPPGHVPTDKTMPFEGAGWESDRIAYRVYLDKRFAVDIYGKKLPGPVLQFIGQGGQSYHDEADWGLDIWRVGETLGAGSPGILRNGVAAQLGDIKTMKAAVVQSGPALAEVKVDITGIPDAPNGMTNDFTLSAGSRLYMNNVSAPGAPLVAGIGKWANTTQITSPKAAKGWGYIATWGRQSVDEKDNVGVALFYPVAEVARTGDDGKSLFVVFKNPAKARYGFAGAWAREGGGLPDEASFRTYLKQTAAELSNPVTVTK